MARRSLSTLITAAISGAIGFGVGVYATPPDKADEFRALVNSKLDEINGLGPTTMHRERAAIEPKAKAPSEAGASTAPEPAPKEIQSAVPGRAGGRRSRRRRRRAEGHAGQQRNAGRQHRSPERNPSGEFEQPGGSGSERRVRCPRRERDAIERRRGRASKTRRQESARRQKASRQKSEAEAEAETRRTPSRSRTRRANPTGGAARPTIGVGESDVSPV